MMLTVADLSLKALFVPFTVFNILVFLLESEMQNVQIFISCGTTNFRIFALAVFIPILLFHFFKRTFAICFSEDHLIYKLINKQKRILFPYLHLLLKMSLLVESHCVSLIISRIVLI